jgi:hypothetical protein
MAYPIKLALLLLSLGAAGAQASPQGAWSPAPVMGSAPSGTVTYEMTTAFGNAITGGTLHSAVYNNGSWGASIFYQITNNASSAYSILGIGNTKSIEESAPPTSDNGWSYPGMWYSQVSGAFGSFVAGTSKAIGIEYLIYSGFDENDVLHTSTFPTVRFTQNEGTDGEKSNGIAPGMSSFTGEVFANDGRMGTSVNLGTVDIDGWKVKSFVSTVPEPESDALMLAGLGLIGAMVKRRKAQAA